MSGAGESWFGQDLECLFSQPQVVARGDLQIQRRALHDVDCFADALEQLRVVGGREAASLGMSFQQECAAEDLRRLRFPQMLARHRLLYLVVFAHALERAGNRRGEDGRAVLFGGGKDRVDPFLGQAWPRGVVHTNVIDVGLHARQGLGDGFGTFGAPFHDVDAVDRRVGGELELKVFAVLRRDDHDHLLDVRPIDELLSRMQPHRLVRQRSERLLVVLIAKAAARAGRRQDHRKLRHDSTS